MSGRSRALRQVKLPLRCRSATLTDTCTVIVTDNGGGTEPRAYCYHSAFAAVGNAASRRDGGADGYGHGSGGKRRGVERRGRQFVRVPVRSIGCDGDRHGSGCGQCRCHRYGRGVSATCAITVEAAAPAYSSLASYSVQDSAFTDGETAVSGGTIENGGFKASAVNSVYVDNPYYNETVTSASIVLELYVADTTQADWSPILGVKESANGYFGVGIKAGNITLWYNAYDGAVNFFEATIAAPTVGNHTILIVTDEDGSISVYYDSADEPVLEVAKGNPSTYLSTTSSETPGVFMAQAERLYFFGGAWGELSVSDDTWTWTGTPWGGSFNGSIVSCDFYSGIIPVSEVFGA